MQIRKRDLIPDNAEVSATANKQLTTTIEMHADEY
jgi:hypothetical protein